LLINCQFNIIFTLSTKHVMSTTNPPNAAPLALVRQELPNLQAIIALNARPGTDVATIAQQELLYLEQAAYNTPAILECEPFSVVMAVKSVMKQNLTMDPQAGLVYVKTRNVKVNNEWKKVLEIQPSANGLVSINRQCGRILDYTNPVVTKDAAGKVTGVSMEILRPSYPQPRWEKYQYDESDFLRWRRASHKDRGRGKADANEQTLNYANALYTSQNGGIDSEMSRAKCIRHSLKKLGTNQNETAAMRIYDVPKDIIVDPGVDQYAQEDEFTPYADVSSTLTTPQTPLDIPNADDL